MIDERDRTSQSKRNHSYVESGLAASQPSNEVTGQKYYSHKISVIFFGSGPVAARSLQLLAQNFRVEAIVTKPTTLKEMQSALPDCPVHVVSSKVELSNLMEKRPFTSKLAVLIDFGIIVTRDVIEYFEHGIVNSHFSLLPEWRGADPISFAILSGQSKTGVSLMLIDEGMDTGKILAQKSIKIASDSTTTYLTSELIDLSNNLLSTHLPAYINGDLKPRNQSHPDRATYSHKLKKEDGIIDWSKPATQLEREIRAYVDWPKSQTKIGDIEVTITQAHVESLQGQAGKLKVSGKQLAIYCGENALVIDRLKPSGKQDMSAESFLAGYRNRL
jgi:methionyl-tRNA formyltransferase